MSYMLYSRPNWTRLKTAPDRVIGPPEDPLTYRWYILPRNRLFNVYLHHTMRSDDLEACHDHPWHNCSVVLSGGYVEWIKIAGTGATYPARVVKTRRPGSVVFRRATTAHVLELIKGKPFWSLFITGPVLRDWGFWCGARWVHCKDYTEPTDVGNRVGKGCAE